MDRGGKWFSHPLLHWHFGIHWRSYGFWLALSGLLVVLLVTGSGHRAEMTGVVSITMFYSVFGAAYTAFGETVSLARRDNAAFLLTRPFDRRQIYDTLFLAGLAPVLLFFTGPALVAVLLYSGRGAALWGPQLLSLAAAMAFFYSFSHVVSIYREKGGNKIVAAFLLLLSLLSLLSLTSSAIGLATIGLVKDTGEWVYSLWPVLSTLVYLVLALVCYLGGRRMFQRLDL